MFGPGEYLPDSTEGITKREDESRLIFPAMMLKSHSMPHLVAERPREGRRAIHGLPLGV
jgi:hypothetical protein